MAFRTFAVALLVIFGFAVQPAAATDTDKATSQAIQRVISSQMEAFKADDATKAFSYAAPFIQEKFGSAEMFMNMVRHGYKPVYRPKYVEFAHLVEGPDGTLAQHVIVQAPGGELMMAVYPMIQDETGNWRIAGVYLALLPREST